MLDHDDDFDHIFQCLPDKLPEPDAFYAKAYFASLDMAGIETEDFLLGYIQALYDCGLADRVDLMRFTKAIAKGSYEHSLEGTHDRCPKCGKDFFDIRLGNSIDDQKRAAWWVDFSHNHKDAKDVLLKHYGLNEEGDPVETEDDPAENGGADGEGGDAR